MRPRRLPLLLALLLLALPGVASKTGSNIIWEENMKRLGGDVGAAFSVPLSGATSLRHGRALDGEKQKKQDEIRTFEILSADRVREQLIYLAKKYPKFATLTDAQTEYGLPAAGNEDDCPFDHTPEFTAGCRNYILTIEDKEAHPKDSASWKSLPEVFLSGALHGDERVGPTSVIEAAAMLLEAAACEALSPHDPDPDKVILAEMCREHLRENGIPEHQRKWLARLVTTRRIVIVPTANALGYYRNERDEGVVDPTFDFPFDKFSIDADECMRTIAARTINEIFREHMFQLSLSFHSGGKEEVIAYGWGVQDYSKALTPDNIAEAQVAQGYANFGGKFNEDPDFHTDHKSHIYMERGNSLGLFEDWSYAGSWDSDRVVQCTPKEHGGYPAEKTSYDKSTLRAFNMLVEASRKNSPDDDLGTTEDLLAADGAGNGHIARNLKLSLLAIELVEPYVSILGADGLMLEDDIVPASDRTGRSCEKSKALLVPKDRGEIGVEWTVGGGFTVDSTYVFQFKWEDLPDSIDGSTHPTDEEWQHLGNAFGAAEKSSSAGRTRWHKDGGTPSETKMQAFGTVFQAKIDVSEYNPGDRIAVFAMAKLDSSWSSQPDDVRPDLPPQSHVVNARTNPDWRHESSGKVVEGRVSWFSIPLTLVIGDDQGGEITVDISSRSNDIKMEDDLGIYSSGGEGMRKPVTLAFVAFGVLVLFLGAMYWRRQSALKRMGFGESDRHLDDTYYDNKNITPTRFSRGGSRSKIDEFDGRSPTGVADFGSNVRAAIVNSKERFVERMDNRKKTRLESRRLAEQFENRMRSDCSFEPINRIGTDGFGNDDIEIEEEGDLHLHEEVRLHDCDLNDHANVENTNGGVDLLNKEEKKEQGSLKSADCILVQGAGSKEVNGAYLRQKGDTLCYIKGARWDGKWGFFNLAPYDDEGKWYVGFVPTNVEDGIKIYMFYEANMDGNDKHAVPRDSWAPASAPRTIDTECKGAYPSPFCIAMAPSDE